MAITAALVKELRERTGAGMMDCKKIFDRNRWVTSSWRSKNYVSVVLRKADKKAGTHCG